MDLDDLIDMCNAYPIYGTFFRNMNRTIKKVNRIANVNIKLMDPTVENIMDIIKSDGLVIILFHWEKWGNTGEHYAMIERMKK